MLKYLVLSVLVKSHEFDEIFRETLYEVKFDFSDLLLLMFPCGSVVQRYIFCPIIQPVVLVILKLMSTDIYAPGHID